MGPFDKDIDIAVNVKARGEDAMENLAQKTDQARNALAELAGTSEAADESLEDINREMYEMGASATAAQSGLGALQAELTAMSSLDEVFGEGALDEVTKDAEKATKMLEKMNDAVDEDIVDASAESITAAQHQAIEQMIEEGDLDRQAMHEEFVASNGTQVEVQKLADGTRELVETTVGGRAPAEYYENKHKEEYAERAETIADIIKNAVGEPGQAALKDRVMDDEATQGFQDFMEYFEGFREYVMNQGMGDPSKDTSWTELKDKELEDFNEALRHFNRVMLNEKDKFDPDTGQRVADLVSNGTLNQHSDKDTIPAATMQVMSGLLDDQFSNLEKGHPLRLLFKRSETEDGSERSPGPFEWNHTRREDEVSGKWQAPTSFEDLGQSVTDGIGQDLAEMMGVPRNEFQKALEQTWSENLLADPSDLASRVISETGEAGVAPSLDTADMEPDRGRVVKHLREFLGNEDEKVSTRVATVFHNLLDDFGGFARGSDFEGAVSDVPLTTETVRTRLFKKFTDAQTDAQRNQILNLLNKIESGAIEMPSLLDHGDSGFRENFEAYLAKQLQNTEIPDEAVPHVASQLQNALLTQMDEGRHTYIENLIGNTGEMNEVFDKMQAELQEMRIEGADTAEVMNALVTEQDALTESVAQSATKTRNYYETLAAPGVRQALGKDNVAFGSFSDREEGDSILENAGLPYAQARRVNEEMKNISQYGFGDGSQWAGLKPTLFEKATENIDTFNKTLETFATKVEGSSERSAGLFRSLKLTSVESVDAADRFSTLTGVLDDLIPRLGISSASLGPLNASMAKTGSFAYGLVALLGPLITSVIGLAGAAGAATAALGGLVGMGAVGYLDHMVQSMAGVNSRAQAMQKLMKALKQDAIQALEPLRNATLGGDGKGGIQLFIEMIEGGMDVLHQFAQIAASIAELEEVQSFVQTVSSALFNGDGGPTMLASLRDMVAKLLPYLEGLFVFVINNAPEFIQFVTNITKKVMWGWAPAFAKLIPLFKLAIGFGARFIMIVGAMVSIVTTLGELIWWVGEAMFFWLDKIPVVGEALRLVIAAIGVLFPALAALVALEFAAQFATWGLSIAFDYLAGTYVATTAASYALTTAKYALIAATYALSGAMTALKYAMVAIPYLGIAAAIGMVVGGLLTMIGATQGATTWIGALTTGFDTIVATLHDVAVMLGAIAIDKFNAGIGAATDGINALQKQLGSLLMTMGVAITLASAFGVALSSPIWITVGALTALVGLMYKLSKGGGILQKTVSIFKDWAKVIEGIHHWFEGIYNKLMSILSAIGQGNQPKSTQAMKAGQKEKRAGKSGQGLNVFNKYIVNANGKDGRKQGRNATKELNKFEKRKKWYSGGVPFVPGI